MTTNTKLDAAACLVTWEDSCIPESQHGKRICMKPPCSRKINPPEQNRSASDRRAAAFRLLELSLKWVSGNETVGCAQSTRLLPLLMAANRVKLRIRRERSFWS